MPNPYYFRSVVDRLWRIANNPHATSLRALDALIREQRALGTPGYAAAQQMLKAVDAYEYARHLLRDLYDRAQTSPSKGSLCPPLPLGEGWGEGSPVPLEEESSDEDDDPL